MSGLFARRLLLGNNLNKFKSVAALSQLKNFSNVSITRPATTFLLNSNVLNQQQVQLNKVTGVRAYSHVPYTKKMIEERILLVLRLCDKINPEKLSLTSSFTKDLGLDSLDHVDVVVAIEDEFGFEIPDSDAELLLTPKHFVQYICDKYDVFE